MRENQELMRIHVEAEFTLDATGRMHSVNVPGGAAAPRFFLGRTAQGNQWWFRHDLNGDLVLALEALCMDEPVGEDIALPTHGPSPYQRLLAEHVPIKKVWTGPAYHFPAGAPIAEETVIITDQNADLLRPYFADWLGDVGESQPFVALLQGGAAVSLCASVRITQEADEAGVETHPDFRGHGFAGRVAASWAHAVRQLGRVPLYSTSWQNTASQAVAKKLGLVQFGADLHIT